MEAIKEIKLKCPKCKGKNFTLIEIWDDPTISWEVIDGKFDLNDGALEPGSPIRVEARCKCGHMWKIRKASQIGNVYL